MLLALVLGSLAPLLRGSTTANLEMEPRFTSAPTCYWRPYGD